MLKEFLYKELRGTILSFKFSITSLICFTIILLSIFIQMKDFKNKLKEFYFGEEINRKNLEIFDSWESIANEGIQISMSPSPLSIFCLGVSNHTGNVFSFSGFSPPTPGQGRYGRNPVLAIFGDLDLTFIVRIILSLFAILYTYDAICGEKEAGTLKLILSNPVKKYHIILGKGLGLFISLLFSFLLPFLIGLIIIIINGINFLLDEWLRLLFSLVFYILFLLCIFLLGLMVSALTYSTNVSFLLLLLIWIFFIILFPSLSTIISNQIIKIPSIQEIQSKKLIFLQEYTEGLKKETARLTNELKSGNISIEEFDSRHREIRKKLMLDMFSKNEKLESMIQKRQNELNRLILRLSIFSPSGSMTFAVSDLSKTSIYQILHFNTLLSFYQKKFLNYIFSKYEKESLMERVFNPDYKIKIDFSEIPKFKESYESIGVSLQRIGVHLCSLILYSIIFFVLSFYSFIKYDPR